MAKAAEWAKRLEWQAGEAKRDQAAKIVAKAQFMTDDAFLKTR